MNLAHVCSIDRWVNIPAIAHSPIISLQRWSLSAGIPPLLSCSTNWRIGRGRGRHSGLCLDGESLLSVKQWAIARYMLSSGSQEDISVYPPMLLRRTMGKEWNCAAAMSHTPLQELLTWSLWPTQLCSTWCQCAHQEYASLSLQICGFLSEHGEHVSWSHWKDEQITVSKWTPGYTAYIYQKKGLEHCTHPITIIRPWHKTRSWNAVGVSDMTALTGI